jgi:gas vesicle protein
MFQSATSRSVLFFLGGAAIGAGAALLFAPTSGRDARRKLKQLSGELAHKASTLQAACHKATVAGKEAFVHTLNGSGKSPTIEPQMHH